MPLNKSVSQSLLHFIYLLLQTKNVKNMKFHFKGSLFIFFIFCLNNIPDYNSNIAHFEISICDEKYLIIGKIFLKVYTAEEN